MGPIGLPLMHKSRCWGTWRWDVSTRFPALERRKTIDVFAPTPLTQNRLPPEGYRARAAQCQQAADRWSGLIKRQYEDLARLWLMVAELTERKIGAARWLWLVMAARYGRWVSSTCRRSHAGHDGEGTGAASAAKKKAPAGAGKSYRNGDRRTLGRVIHLELDRMRGVLEADHLLHL